MYGQVFSRPSTGAELVCDLRGDLKHLPHMEGYWQSHPLPLKAKVPYILLFITYYPPQLFSRRLSETHPMHWSFCVQRGGVFALFHQCHKVRASKFICSLAWGTKFSSPLPTKKKQQYHNSGFFFF